MKDVNGREYAKLFELRVGSIVQVDDGFDCLVPWSKHEVIKDDDNQLGIKCIDGHHGFNGQLEGEHLIGIYNV